MSSERADRRTVADGGASPERDASRGTTSDDSVFAPEVREFFWLGAAINGAVAFLTQYLLVAILFVLGPLSSGADTVFERLTAYAFVVFGTHHVPVVRTAREVTLQGPSRVNPVTNAQDPTILVGVYLAIPVVALLIAGAIFYCRHADGPGTDYERAVLTGIGHAGGYLAVGLLAAVVFVATTTFDSGSVTEAVDRIVAVVSLIAYPAIFATIGALTVAGYRRYVA